MHFSVPKVIQINLATEKNIRRTTSLFFSLAQRGGKTMLVPCDKEYPAFVSERTIKETVGNIDCESCVK